MWRINKPDIEKAQIDVDTLHALGYVPIGEVFAMKELVKKYDEQDGSITDVQLCNISAATTESMHKAYVDDELYNQGKAFHPVRIELYADIDRCPYCSVNQADMTLDHVLPKSRFKALSMCRLNLVPACWACNGKKGRKPYTDFIHPYYTGLPDGLVFFKAEVMVVNNAICIKFYVDPNALSQDKYNTLCSQIKHLKLNEVLSKSAVAYIQNEIIDQYIRAEAVVESIPLLLNKTIRNYGPNDWRCAILRGMMEALQQPGAQNLIDVAINTKNNRRDVGA